MYLHPGTSDIDDIRLADQNFVAEPAAVLAALVVGLVAGAVASAAAFALRFGELVSEGASAELSPNKST